MVGDALVERGHEVTVRPASERGSLEGFGAVIVGAALYANRWHADARRFVERHIDALRRVPTWFFSSGPLDASAEAKIIAPTTEAAVLMERVGALGHMTFGGRLSPDARGFPASAMAKNHAGDWRDREHVVAWASEIASALADARPRAPVEPPGRSLGRLLLHGVAGWALCAAVMGALLAVAPRTVALAIHAAAVPFLFGAVARHYFAARGARGPLFAAITFVLVTGALDLAIVSGVVLRSISMFTSFVGTWLPLGLIFLVTWAIGALMSTMPWPKPDASAARPPPPLEAH
jgi:menaquinone-dependent protoporphyrinogen oxidase